jgi:predicted nucleotidyltransferase
LRFLRAAAKIRSMRLSETQRQAIVQVVHRRFGEAGRVWLFGSRVDDQARGGDIDLYVETPLADPAAAFAAELRARVDLERALGEQRIDLVVHRIEQEYLPIHRLARDTGIPLE